MTIQAISSPCNSICTMDEKTGFCNGCMRTIEEIMQWGSADNQQKQAVLDTLDARWFNARSLHADNSR